MRDCRQSRTLCQLGGRGVGVDEGLQEKVRLVKEGRREEGCGKKGGNSQLRGEPGTKSLEVKAFQVFVRTYRQCGVATVKSGELRMERYKA